MRRIGSPGSAAAVGVIVLIGVLGCSDDPRPANGRAGTGNDAGAGQGTAGGGGDGGTGGVGQAGAGQAGQGQAGAGQAGQGGMALGASCDELPDPHCDHPIDRVLVPLLRGADLAIREASPHEHCRRLAIDLLGRTPRPAELTACVAAAPRGRPALFQASPDHARQWGRIWGERIGYDDQYVWYWHLVELDALVRSLAQGATRYDDFASELAVHPAFYARHQGNDWSATLVSILLGRPARPDEIAGLRPLLRIFGARTSCDGAVWWNLEAVGPGQGDEGCGRTEFGVNLCGCLPAVSALGCRSTTFGEISLSGCRDPSRPFEDVNLLRVTERSLGQRTTCPNGQPGCADRAFEMTAYRPSQVPAVPLSPITSAERDQLHAIGRAFTARGDFWEAAVDRELRRLLGWWQSGLRRPDWDLPAVRRVLADELRRTGSLAGVETLITSSLLYVQPQLADTPGDRPPWSLGPTKLLVGETWLDSAAVAVGETLGSCDYRFFSLGGVAYDQADGSLVERTPISLAGFEEQTYLDLGLALGGCSATPRPTQSSLSLVSSQQLAARILCVLGNAVMPPRFDPRDNSRAALEAAARYAGERVLGRPLEDAEVTAIGGEMRACLDAGAQGCDSPEAAVRWTCGRLLESAEFGLY